MTAILLAIWAAFPIMTAKADTIRDAMVAAYQQNFKLQAQRYKTRATDETVSGALAGYRPKVQAEAHYGYSQDDKSYNAGTNSDGTSYGYGVSIEQPLFDGFRTQSAVSEAESNVSASHKDLLSVENDILLDSSTTYLDVIRDEGVVLFRKKNLTALRRELIGVREQYQRGEVTVTDIEQAKVRLSLARSELEQAKAKLEDSRLRYFRITRREPKDLVMPKLPTDLIPASLDEAVNTAIATSPIISAADHRRQAALHAVDKERSALLPSASITARYGEDHYDNSHIGREDELSVMGRLVVPLYQGGAVSSQIRRAKHLVASFEREAKHAEAKVAQITGSAWIELKATIKRRDANREAAKASERALEGVKAEQKIGRRTVLNVLDAENEVVNARISLLNSQRDLHVSVYKLLHSMGDLTIKRIVPAADRYDPNSHYQQVRNKWGGTTTVRTSDQHLLGNDGRGR